MISSNNVLDSLVNSADAKNTLDSLVVPSNSPTKARLPPIFSVSFKNRLIIRCSNKWHVSWSAGKEYAEYKLWIMGLLYQHGSYPKSYKLGGVFI